jgi:hypothetical protein
MKELRADKIWGRSAAVWPRIFYLPLGWKINNKTHINMIFPVVWHAC